MGYKSIFIKYFLHSKCCFKKSNLIKKLKTFPNDYNSFIFSPHTVSHQSQNKKQAIKLHSGGGNQSSAQASIDAEMFQTVPAFCNSSSENYSLYKCRRSGLSRGLVIEEIRMDL